MKHTTKLILFLHLCLGLFQNSQAIGMPSLTGIIAGIKKHFGAASPVEIEEDTFYTSYDGLEDADVDILKIFPLLKKRRTSTIDLVHEAISKPTSIITHIELLHELKLKFKLVRVKPASPEVLPIPDPAASADSKLTQTEAYLARYKSEVESAFGASHWGGITTSSLKKYETLIDQIISKEKELSHTHYMFYHAHTKELIILQDFIKQLHSYIKLIGPRFDFACMRHKDIHAIPYKNVNEYLDAHAYSIHDHDELTRTQMISVNLALFGNHNSWGECTFRYFLNNTSISGAALYDRLSPIFSHYNFDTKYLGELTSLSSYLTSPTGNLLQICIPQDMVNDLVYLSVPFGKPYSSVVLKDHYDYKKDRHTSIRPLLDHMKASAHSISGLGYWQGRLMFFDPMLDMHPAIKVFRYNTIPAEQMALYQRKLKEIVINIILDYVKSTGEVHKEPLAKLYHYMMLHKDEFFPL